MLDETSFTGNTEVETKKKGRKPKNLNYFDIQEECRVFADREQLVMAIQNLIENAINYSSNGTRVTISVRSDDNRVEILVKDQGIGISESDIDRIFERFYRVDPARSRETGGTGLGLAIVKHIVRIHGGDISVWSAKGVGSTFSIKLPIGHDVLPEDE